MVQALAVFNQRRALTRRIKKIGSSKWAKIDKMVSLKGCALAMVSLAKKIMRNHVSHVGPAIHSCSKSNLVRITWKLWMVLALLDVVKVAWQAEFT